MLMIAFIALLVLAALLVVINRDSEKIVSAAVPLAFAMFSALALIFAFAREEPMTRIFPVSFSYQVADKLPLGIPGRPDPMQLILVDLARQQNPKVLEEIPDAHGRLIYHEFLQKMLVDWIAFHHTLHWHVDIFLYETGPGGMQSQVRPMPDADRETSEILYADELQRILAQNRFASVHTMVGALALPPRTTLKIETPKESAASGEIRFKNKYSDITIQTSPTVGGTGLGNYWFLANPPGPTPEYWTQQYMVRIRATFSPWLVGHPRMARIKQWATGILNGLQQEFDERAVWRKTVENYMLRRHLSDKIVFLPPGPIRVPPGEKLKR